MEKRKIHITETVLRDGHQSLLATRMKTQDMLPILQKMDQVGYWSVEMWGGATFDSCIRFLREDPWERLQIIRKAMPNTRLQMLLRGQNLVGYTHYADDVVEKFIEKAVHHGMDVFRIFDALNDTRNMKTAIQSVVKNGKIAEGTLSYTTSPYHNTQHFVDVAQELIDLGCQTLCIKDMAGLLTPSVAQELVAALKKQSDVPIHVHTHATSGMAEGMYLQACQAGASIIDTAISSMAGGTSQPPTESLVAMLEKTPLDTGLHLPLLSEIAEYFKEVRKKYIDFESPYNAIDPRVLIFQVPGGMISNLANQLREQDALDKMEEVLSEIPKVRKEMGYPPLVTPTSQIVGTQATLNILMQERYKVFTTESRLLLLGKYGKTIASKEASLVQKAAELQKESPIECRPADLLPPAWENTVQKARENGGESEEDALTFALFPSVAKAFFVERARQGLPPEDIALALAAILHTQLQEKQQASSPSSTSSVSRWKWAGRTENTRRT